MKKFEGEYTSEHYEKDLHDLTGKDLAVLGTFLALIMAAICLGILEKWGVMIVCIGLAVIMVDVILRVTFHAKNKIATGFAVLGAFVILAGVLVTLGHADMMVMYGFCMAGLAWLFVGVLCMYLAHKKKKKNLETSQNESTFMETMMGISGIVIAIIWFGLIALFSFVGIL